MDTTKALFEKLIIQLAPTGMVPDKTDTPYTSITYGEIIDDTLETFKKGVLFAHMHTRDEQVGGYMRVGPDSIYYDYQKRVPVTDERLVRNTAAIPIV
jgi:hypothetical protein